VRIIQTSEFNAWSEYLFCGFYQKFSYPDDDTDEEERQREKEKAEFVAGVKRMRNEATVPDTLMVLTMKHIMNKCSYFSSKPQYHFLALPSPFKNLREYIIINLILLTKSSQNFQPIQSCKCF